MRRETLPASDDLITKCNWVAEYYQRLGRGDLMNTLLQSYDTLKHNVLFFGVLISFLCVYK